jgi:hypothetical protein
VEISSEILECTVRCRRRRVRWVHDRWNESEQPGLSTGGSIAAVAIQEINK